MIRVLTPVHFREKLEEGDGLFDLAEAALRRTQIGPVQEWVGGLRDASR